MAGKSGTRFPRGSSIVAPLSLAGIVGFGLIGALVGVGCVGGNISPFLAAQFAQNTIGTNLPGRPTPPSDTPDDGDGDGDNDTLETVCELEAGQARSIQMSLINQAQQPVQFAMTFLVSAGSGGFVCEEELANYLNAGYVDRLGQGQTSLLIGCDEVTLASGDRLLALEFGVNRNQRLDIGGSPGATLTLTTSTNNINIPVPEVIVFGNNDTMFKCVGNAPCTQNGFVYVSNSNIQVGKPAQATRIQGTLCAEGFGNEPEWRLDKTLNDGEVLTQYVGGSVITVTVLDRSGDSLNNTRNQVVWRVVDADGTRVIHAEDPGG